jgi:hypothetical protein
VVIVSKPLLYSGIQRMAPLNFGGAAFVETQITSQTRISSNDAVNISEEARWILLTLTLVRAIV